MNYFCRVVVMLSVDSPLKYHCQIIQYCMDDAQLPVFDLCILIPCYNNYHGLTTSVNSIVCKERSLLILIIDDGSREPVTIQRLQQPPSVAGRMEVIRLEQNKGITKALNTGLDAIYNQYNVRFIARLDCGDICAPQRFDQQLGFLERNPGIDLLGTWCYFKDTETGSAYKYVTPTQHNSIKNGMYFRNLFIHPSVMWRVAAMRPFRYPENYPHAEDYGLFYDMCNQKNTAILSEFLLTCEINPQGISFVNRFAQLRSRLRVIWHYGTDSWRLAAGSAKLLLLMALPFRLVYWTKKHLLRA